jgi:acetate kinase
VSAALEGRSGLVALTADTGDMRRLLERVDGGDELAAAALAVYVHRLAREVAAMAAAAGGLQALVFTGGVGEHAPAVRAAAAAKLAFLGVGVDAAANEAVTGDAEIGVAGGPVRTLVVTAREDLEIAGQVRLLLAGR